MADKLSERIRTVYGDTGEGRGAWAAEVAALEARAAAAEALAYIDPGAMFAEDTYKARLDELVPQHRALEQHAAALARKVDGFWSELDDALSDVWRNRDGSTKHGVSKLVPGMKKAHEVLRARAARARASEGEGT